MTARFQTIRSISTSNFLVQFSACERCDLDLSWDETGEITAKLDRYELTAFDLEVRVFCGGSEVGTSYLGQCIYADPSDVLHDGYGKDMLREAITEARQNLSALRSIKIRA